MELDRDAIVRKDFKHSLRGYDEWEVQAHLKQVNQAVSVLIDDMMRGKGDLPPAAQERVQARVTMARLEAAELVADAREQAESEKDEVNRLVLKTIEQAAEEVDRMLAEGRAQAARIVEEARREDEARRREAAEQIDQVRDRVLEEARVAAEQMLAQARAESEAIRQQATQG